MKVFKKKGELTRFQILAEIAKQQPHLRQKDIAKKLGITVQAVSENLKSLVDDGFVVTGLGRARYKITKRGIDKVKMEATDLKKYADEVMEIMGTYKSVWPAIAEEELKSGERVWLKMENGTLYATREKRSAYAEVLNDASKGEDVALIKLGGIIELYNGKVTIVKLPTVNQGGSRACNINRIKEIYLKGFDKVGIMGTVSKAVADKLKIKADFEYATPYATTAAAKRGLNVLVFAVGKMTNSITKKLDNEGIEYQIEDVKQSDS
ncbi:MAG: winged helix-turn-helix transcriptional regulator [Euryarchaeota archaeon]|nr:winged helix-turn-helix transcriptional regulator [Euryarchaeota archaeon]